MLSPEDARLVSFLHSGFPLTDRPFADVAAQLGSTEDAVIERLQRLLGHGDLSRFAPLFQIESAGERLVLAAMAVPEQRFDAVAAVLGAMPEVAHHYRRESAHPDQPNATPLNMWFMLAVESRDQIACSIFRIEKATGLKVFDFPKEREFFVETQLPLQEVAGHGT